MNFLRKFCLLYVFFGFLWGAAQAEQTTTDEARFDTWVSELPVDRLERDAYIYYDSYNKMSGASSIFISRSQRGPGINKVSGHKEMPKLNRDQILLGHVERVSENPVQYAFTSQDGADPILLEEDELVEVPSLSLGIWYYEYEGAYYLDLYNYERPFLERFLAPQFFSYNPNWAVHARFVEQRETLTTPASNGENWDDERLGWIYFNYDGVEHRVAVYEYDDFDKTSGEAQIRYGDASEKTYAGGRYLYVKHENLKNPEGFQLNFNFSFDPPCAWSQAYHCSLIRVDESLPIPVEAGYITPLWDIY